MPARENETISGKIEADLRRREASSAENFAGLRAQTKAIEEIAGAILSTLRSGNKVLAAGNGGSAAEAQHFAAELIGRFKRERDPYPAISLTADTSVLTALGNDYGFDEVFARQIRGLGNAGDLFIAFSTSGRSENLVKAAKTAGELGIGTVAITGERESPLADLCEFVFRSPSSDTATIQEIHMLFTHVVCDVVEENLSKD